MPHIDHHTPGSFCWFELATSDQLAAKKFYQSLFGWDVHDSPMGPTEVYTTFKLDGRGVAAAYTLRKEQQAQGVPPNWMIYVAVTNADAAAKHAAELGGKVLAPPFDVMDLGRMSVIQDPTGAVFSVWQAKTHAGTGITGGNGVVCWADLDTPDQAHAAKFYGALFGWKATGGKAMNPPKPGDYYHIVNGADFIGGIPGPAHRDPHVPPHWMIYVEVADCQAATAKAKSLGARAYVEPMKIGEEGWVSVLADPQGAVFALHQTTRK
jgi:predicted enzyme related to lactoylglutathione lyase